MFDNIFSVESIVSLAITITVSFAVTFKIIKLNLTIKNKSHTIKGDGNSIEHNEFNIVMKETQGEFRNPSFASWWDCYFYCFHIVALLSIISYIIFLFTYCSLFLCCWYTAFILWARGFSNRFFDCFYIVPDVI